MPKEENAATNTICILNYEGEQAEKIERDGSAAETGQGNHREGVKRINLKDFLTEWSQSSSFTPETWRDEEAAIQMGLASYLKTNITAPCLTAWKREAPYNDGQENTQGEVLLQTKRGRKAKGQLQPNQVQNKAKNRVAADFRFNSSAEDELWQASGKVSQVPDGATLDVKELWVEIKVYKAFADKPQILDFSRKLADDYIKLYSEAYRNSGSFSVKDVTITTAAKENTNGQQAKATLKFSPYGLQLALFPLTKRKPQQDQLDFVQESIMQSQEAAKNEQCYYDTAQRLTKNRKQEYGNIDTFTCEVNDEIIFMYGVQVGTKTFPVKSTIPGSWSSIGEYIKKNLNDYNDDVVYGYAIYANGFSLDPDVVSDKTSRWRIRGLLAELNTLQKKKQHQNKSYLLPKGLSGQQLSAIINDLSKQINEMNKTEEPPAKKRNTGKRTRQEFNGDLMETSE